MTCYCSGCVTASLRCSLVSETFTIQTENPLFFLYPRLNFNGKFAQNQLCLLSARGEWINTQLFSLENYCIWPFLFFNFVFFCLLLELKYILEVICFCQLLMCRHWIVFLRITALFSALHSPFIVQTHIYFLIYIAMRKRTGRRWSCQKSKEAKLRILGFSF